MKNLEVKQKCTVTYVDGGSIRKTPEDMGVPPFRPCPDFTYFQVVF